MILKQSRQLVVCPWSILVTPQYFRLLSLALPYSVLSFAFCPRIISQITNPHKPSDHTAIHSITVSAIRADHSATRSHCHTLHYSLCHQITLSSEHTAIPCITVSAIRADHSATRSHCHTFHYSLCHQITLPSDHTATRSHCHQITLPYLADNPCLMKGKRRLSRRNPHKRRAITIPGGEKGGEGGGGRMGEGGASLAVNRNLASRLARSERIRRSFPASVSQYLRANDRRAIGDPLWSRVFDKQFR